MPEATLNPLLISRTVDRLRERIEARFPESGLGRVAARLSQVAAKAGATSEWIDRPIVGLRIAVWALGAVIVLGLGLTLWNLPLPKDGFELGQFIQVLEAGINDVVLVAAAIFFLATIETRIKRHRALGAIHELRSIAHVIDMHQLTKDPEWTLQRGAETGHVKRDMTSFELARYLDYCSEMLALTAKIAALYIQRFDDGVALQAVNEVESLTNGLSRKIWQKLMILYQMHGQAFSPPGTPPR